MTPERKQQLADLRLGVLRQYIRYCEQWQREHGPFPKGDGRELILRNAKEAVE